MEHDLKELASFRKELHKHPEVSGKEKETSNRIIEFLKAHQPDELITGLGGYGAAAVYNGPKPGKTILIRCELDGLPIQEVSNYEHSSIITGKSHMCGHDGHMAIVAGLAQKYSRRRPPKGKIVLLFQPAEENGEGAKAVLADSRFRDLKPDFVFALHNLPGHPLHEVILKKGSFTAAVNSMVISLKGRTSHAGEPDKGINPALAMAEIIQKVNDLNNPDQHSDKFRQITYVHASMGEKAYGVSAGNGELGFTFRCWSTEERDLLGKEMEAIAYTAGKTFGLSIEINYTESFHANRNDDQAIDIIEKAALEETLKISWRDVPHRWGEDFGIFTEEYTGALFGMGAGEGTPALHNPDYDFPDDLIDTGVRMFYSIIENINNE